MKKTVLAVVGLVCAVMLGACKPGSDDESINWNDDAMRISFPEYAAGDIVRNAVNSFDGKKYYDYLTFDSATGGTYAMYDGNVTPFKKLDVHPFDESELPTRFLYSASEGKVSATVGEDEVYFFNEGGTCYMASENISPAKGTNKDILCLEKGWKTANESIFIFKDGKDGKKFTCSKSKYEGTYTNADGFIQTDIFYESGSGRLSFAYTQDEKNGAFNLYYVASKTERSKVEEVGRATGISGNGVVMDFVSNQFMLVRSGKTE